MQIEGDQLRGHLETMVLSALERGPAHGFELMQRLEKAGCGALKLKEGTLYPVLYRLESAGLIKGAWDGDEAPRKGPRRRVYRLNRKARKHLAERRAQWEHFVRIIGNIVEKPA